MSVTTAFELAGTTWRVELARGDELEQRAMAQLQRLLARFNLSKWIFTHHVRIESGARPHSHPVLTLNTRNVEHEDRALATFLHEQLHWFADARPTAAQSAIDELRRMYPLAPGTLPDGARDQNSTYLHLIRPP